MIAKRLLFSMLALFWVVATSPYLLSSLLLAHGDHAISVAQIEDGRLTLVYEDLDGHHADHRDHQHTSHEEDSNHRVIISNSSALFSSSADSTPQQLAIIIIFCVIVVSVYVRSTMRQWVSVRARTFPAFATCLSTVILII